ncbi:MAG: AAA family ATPase [Chloroflexota bacterium]
MTKVVIIGNAGGGKSTLCRRLGESLDIAVFSIDHIQWKPGWVLASTEEFDEKHQAILERDCWIIDGWGDWPALEQRFQEADTIIFVDHPLYIHYWWAIKRQIKCIFRPRIDGPEGCPMLPMTWSLLKMIWRIHWESRPRLLSLIDTFAERKRVIHIQSPNALGQFLRQYC